MYAVIRTGGKQHRVAANDHIIVERLNGAPGEVVSFDDVLMLHDGETKPLIGGAVPDAARVFAEVVAQQRGPKVLVFKKLRRKNHRRLNGHRQDQTVVRITAISPDGAQPRLTPEQSQAAAPMEDTPVDEMPVENTVEASSAEEKSSTNENSTVAETGTGSDKE